MGTQQVSLVIPDKLRTFSASRLDAFRCPYRWREIYIEGHREPDTEETRLGRAVHAILQRVVLQAQEEGCFPKPRSKKVSQIITEVVEATQDPTEPFGKSTVEEIGRMARKGMEVLVDVDPASVLSEYHFKVPLPAGLQGYLEGYVDLLVLDGSKGKIVDFKTGRKTYDVLTDSKLQLPLYGLAISQLWPGVSWELQLHFLRSGTMAVSTFDKAAAAQAEAYLVDRVKAIWSAVENNSFPPLPGSHCSHCPVAENCPAATTPAAGEDDAERLFGLYLATEARLRVIRERLQKLLDESGMSCLQCNGEYMAYYETASKVWIAREEVAEFLRSINLNPNDYLMWDQAKLRKLADEYPVLLTLAHEKLTRRFEHRSSPPEYLS